MCVCVCVHRGVCPSKKEASVLGKWTELHVSQVAFWGQMILTVVLHFPPAAALGGAGVEAAGPTKPWQDRRDSA